MAYKKKKKKQQQQDDRTGIFPFLKLPPELRNRIYRYSFAAYDTILTRRCPGRVKDLMKCRLKGEIVLRDAIDGKNTLLEPCFEQHGNVNLVRVCKQICEESRFAPYGFNTFVFESVFVFKHFACVAFNGSEHIRDVRVAFPLQEVSGWDASAVIRKIPALPRLENLIFGLELGTRLTGVTEDTKDVIAYAPHLFLNRAAQPAAERWKVFDTVRLRWQVEIGRNKRFNEPRYSKK